MAYAKFDDGFADHPKVRQLTPGGFQLHVAGILHCARWATGGYVDRESVQDMARRSGGSRSITELIEAGLWVATADGVRVVHAGVRGNDRVPISRTTRAEVFARDGHACLICGSDERLTIDHIDPVSAGGSNAIDNLRTLCHSCNARRGAARLSDEELRGRL